VRAAGELAALAAVLRREVPRAHVELRVRAVEPMTSFVTQQMIRERLLAALSGFFAFVALVLVSIGLYGVLNSAVVRQRREIGIRMALGARASHVVRGVTAQLFTIAALGALIGLAGGIAFGRVVRTLLFQVTPTDISAAVAPGLTLAIAALVAALPPAIRAVRIDPAQTLRAE
jgi:ABC-type antimicrobial peptide transport system permease subunit